MDRKTINSVIEAYINKTDVWSLPEFEFGISSSEKFELRTAKRLKTAFDLYEKDQSYYGDFLLAFRDYLLVLQTNTVLNTVEIPENNKFGIIKDPDSNSYFALNQSPEYINSGLVEAVFSHKEPEDRVNRDANLYTDPLIRKITGYSFFKNLSQKLAVYGALNTPPGYTTLVSLPTGGGKSLITQTMAYQKEGLSIIIVPTVSLAIDQVRVAKDIIRSENDDEEIFFYSSGVDLEPILTAIKDNRARMLFISPESLINNPNFIKVINEANEKRYLNNIIIDEAHIVVDWGASFRVNYQCLESWRKKLISRNPEIRTILLSATFENHCVTILKSFFSNNGTNWLEVRCDALRHEPRFALIKAKNYTEKTEKMLELVRKMPHPMIIYVAYPDEADNVASVLRKQGIQNVRTFTGKTTGTKRKELIDAWVDDRFEIMVATSAFGVGVDKSDVRTVLHLYVPANPNAYYQELGRGGRDRLPCLSIMLIYQDDLKSAYSRISKRVMTSEKIVGRWNSMYSSPDSVRRKNLIYMDTSVKPSYSSDERDILDDSPISDADVNWNVYVLLFLRRYGLIDIHEVISDKYKYTFIIEIKNELLRSENQQQFDLIEELRTEEYVYFEKSFKSMRYAIQHADTWCWSEMFYKTYDKVSEYCAGCNNHKDIINGDFMDYPLKAGVKETTRELTDDQLARFGSGNNLVIMAPPDERAKVFATLSRLRISAFVSDSKEIIEECCESMAESSNVLFLNSKDLITLAKKKNYYYLSGLIAIYYSGTSGSVRKLLDFSTKYLNKHPGIKVIHILAENQYFDSIDKSFTDLINGPVISANIFN